MMTEINDRPMPLAELIKLRRTTLRLTQQRIADRLGVTPESVGLWERRRRRVELDRVPELAAALELNQEDVARIALFEDSPHLYAALFGSARPPHPRTLNQ